MIKFQVMRGGPGPPAELGREPGGGHLGYVLGPGTIGKGGGDGSQREEVDARYGKEQVRRGFGKRGP